MHGLPGDAVSLGDLDDRSQAAAAIFGLQRLWLANVYVHQLRDTIAEVGQVMDEIFRAKIGQ
ncbi:MAG TPA: hypothetical protein VE464_08455 [Streptosporangiaceae bacterium]|nr:hypothetical protein [Streptosporangiaceae bacterium]